jgi:hypothetical protein
MAIMPQIAMGFQMPQFQAPQTANTLALISQLEGQREANELRRLQAAQLMRAQEQENALLRLTPQDLQNNPAAALAFGAPGRQMYSSLLQGQEARRKAELAEAQTIPEKIKLMRFGLGAVESPEQFASWRAQTARLLPGLADVLPQEFTPDVKRNIMLDAEKLYERVFESIDGGNVREVLALNRYGGGPAETVATREVGARPQTAEQAALTRARTEEAQAGIAVRQAELGGTLPARPQTAEQAALTRARTEEAQAGTAVRQAELGGTLPARPVGPTELAKLLAEQKQFTPDTAEFKAYQTAIDNYKQGVTIQTPVPVVDPKTGQVTYATREEAIGKTPPQFIEGLSPRERQQREAKLPAAQQALVAFEAKVDKLDKLIEEFVNHPGVNEITGLIGGRIVGITEAGRRAEALYNTIMAQGGFNELQSMRDASPTGGALGNVSNQENQYLRDAFGVTKRTQSKGDLIRGFRDVQSTLRSSKLRVRQAFEDTYAYREGAQPASRGAVGDQPPAPSTPAAAQTVPAPPRVGDVQQGYRFKGGDPANRNSWEKVD